jgi:cyclomaltodextrinase / maltogenic alpha-amylase / neopullulanase
VPDWAPDIVYYYVFPERFRNGDRANDPQPGATATATPDGREAPALERQALQARQRRRQRRALQQRLLRRRPGRHGIDKLDDIRDLGANTIYMTPVFRPPATTSTTPPTTRVDPAFGSNADFERLTREAAKARHPRHPRHQPEPHRQRLDLLRPLRQPRQRRRLRGRQAQPDSPYFSWYRFDPRRPNPTSSTAAGWA